MRYMQSLITVVQVAALLFVAHARCSMHCHQDIRRHMCNSRLQIHWFSIINSCVTVLLLTGFLATILMRVLKKDFVKYTRDDEAGAC